MCFSISRVKNVAKYQRYIVNISSVEPSDTIFANESRFLEKSEKISQYRRYIDKLQIYSTQKIQACENFFLKKTDPYIGIYH